MDNMRAGSVQSIALAYKKRRRGKVPVRGPWSILMARNKGTTAMNSTVLYTYPHPTPTQLINVNNEMACRNRGVVAVADQGLLLSKVLFLTL